MAADPQRIHPVTQDVEAPQEATAPLVTQGTLRSEKGDPATEQYPPLRRTFPVMYSKPPKKRSCFCRCLCWTISLVLLFIIVIAITAGILYLVFKPKLPKYSIDELQITQFNLTDNSTLHATFDVTITARNPNKKIGIYYEGGSHVSVWYTDTDLCEGSLPKFYQGHQNTTVLDVTLTGSTYVGNGLITTLEEEQQQSGIIPLKLRVKQPVRIKLGKLKLMKIKFLVKCELDVNSLSANSRVSIKDSRCKFSFRL